MSDLISRQDVLKLPRNVTRNFFGKIVEESIDVERIEALPSAQRWIPCSERLPEAEKKSYWICTDTEYQCECLWTNVNPYWTNLTTDWHWHIFDIPEFTKVIAWMPLIEPYREESRR